MTRTASHLHGPDRIIHDGREYLSSPLAAQMLGMDASVIRDWGRCCPWLDGRPLTFVERTFGGRVFRFFLAADLEAARQAKAKAQDWRKWKIPDRISRNGQDYVRIDEAIKLLGRRPSPVSRGAFYKWVDACPYLAGRRAIGLCHEPYKGRDIAYYAVSDLEAIRLARLTGATVPSYDDATYIGDICRDFHLDGSKLRKLFAQWGIETGRGKVRFERRPAKTSDGRRCWRRYAPNEFVVWLRKRSAVLPAGTVTVAQASKRLGMTPVGVHGLERKGELVMQRGVLVPSQRGYLCEGNVVEIASLEAAIRRRAPRPTFKSFTDTDGKVFISIGHARQLRPNVPARVLAAYADKPMPFAGGRVLETRMIRRWPDDRATRGGLKKPSRGFFLDAVEAIPRTPALTLAVCQAMPPVPVDSSRSTETTAAGLAGSPQTRKRGRPFASNPKDDADIERELRTLYYGDKQKLADARRITRSEVDAALARHRARRRKARNKSAAR